MLIWCAREVSPSCGYGFSYEGAVPRYVRMMSKQVSWRNAWARWTLLICNERLCGGMQAPMIKAWKYDALSLYYLIGMNDAQNFIAFKTVRHLIMMTRRNRSHIEDITKQRHPSLLDNKGLPPIKIFKAQRRHSTVLERGTRSSITLRRLWIPLREGDNFSRSLSQNGGLGNRRMIATSNNF